jgi:hypothetical protein
VTAAKAVPATGSERCQALPFGGAPGMGIAVQVMPPSVVRQIFPTSPAAMARFASQ